MHAIEREIIKITKYKVQRKFDDRQDYLRSVLLAVQNLDDSKFDELSDEAAEWANACVEIENGKRGADLPDFDEVEAEDEPDEVVENDFTEGDPDDDGEGSSEDEDESDGSDDEDSDDAADETSEDEASNTDDEAEDSEDEVDYDPDDDSDDDEAEAESDEVEDLEDEDAAPTSEDGGENLTVTVKHMGRAPATNLKDYDFDDDDEDLDEGPVPKPLKKAAAGKASKTVLKGKLVIKKAKAPKIPPKEEKIPNPPRRPRPEPGNDIELDKWGCMIGSKNSKALALFENGATSGEIKRELGGTYYNVLKKMIEQGHRLEKYGAITKLIHRDELAPKKPKKK